MLLELPQLPMTSEDFEKLPNVEGVRYELVEGNLVIMNAFYAAWHGHMIHRLLNLFSAHGYSAFPERGVRIGPGDRRSADIGVFHKPLTDLQAAFHDPAEFSHLVEVLSADSRDNDWHDKPRVYASAGIPEYWIVDEHPTDNLDGVVSMHRLTLSDDGRHYVLYRQASVKQLESEGLPGPPAA